MTTGQYLKVAALENQAFSLMSMLHVTMRRQYNRVTDIEYMRINPDYCRHLLSLALQSDNEELKKIGVKLQEIYFGENGLFVIAPPKPPLFDRRKNPSPFVNTQTTSSPHVAQTKTKTLAEEPKKADPPAEIQRNYVGSLR